MDFILLPSVTIFISIKHSFWSALCWLYYFSDNNLFNWFSWCNVGRKFLAKSFECPTVLFTFHCRLCCTIFRLLHQGENDAFCTHHPLTRRRNHTFCQQLNGNATKLNKIPIKILQHHKGTSCSGGAGGGECSEIGSPYHQKLRFWPLTHQKTRRLLWTRDSLEN